jgi:hypothetical protein
MNNLASIASYCNFVSILETMLDNLEYPKTNENYNHRYIIVESALIPSNQLTGFKFDKIHSCYMSIKLDYECKEDAEFDATRCNFTNESGKYIVVEI